jgi:hypothetical protein
MLFKAGTSGPTKILARTLRLSPAAKKIGFLKSPKTVGQGDQMLF